MEVNRGAEFDSLRFRGDLWGIYEGYYANWKRHTEWKFHAGCLVATRRWTITGAGNLRRIVNTPGHTFLVVENRNEVLALYRSCEDPTWITVAAKRTLAEAKAALLPCAIEAQVQWQ